MVFCCSLTLLYMLTSCSQKTVKDDVPVQDTLQVPTDTLRAEPDSLFILLDNLKSDSVMKHASLGFYIYNMTRDTVLAAHNAYQSLVPASTMKLFTSAAAIEILGPATRFKTVLSHDGSISNKVLNGNIYITGGGDPAFGSALYNGSNVMEQFATAIAALEIDTINGHIVADPRIFNIDEVPYTWPHGEINSAYAAPASGLSIYDNTYVYEVRSSDKGVVTADASRMKPPVPAISFRNMFFLGNDTRENLVITGQPGSNKKIIRGAFPSAQALVPLKGSIPDPPYMAAFVLFESLLKRNIFVKGSPITVYDNEQAARASDKKQLAVIYSPDVLSLVNHVNTHSNNLFAEHLLKHIGLRKYGSGDTESGCSAVTAFLRSKSIDVNGFFMFDGSGLSRFNAVTARQLTDVLLLMEQSPAFNGYFNSMSKAGATGTLKRLCVGSDAQDKINAKSGTMSRVKSYAGYALALNGDTLAFAFIANNFICPASDMTTRFEEIMIKMVAH